MSNFAFTPDDQMQPVYCVGCRLHIPRAVSNAGRGLCPACVTKLQAPVQTPPATAPPVAQTNFSSSRPIKPNLTWFWLTAGLVAMSAVGYAVVAKVKVDQRRASLQAVLAKLKMQYPDRRFALSIGDGSIRFNEKLSDLVVDKVAVEKREKSLRAGVTFSSIYENRRVRPRVFVSAFDEKGKELGRFAVVDHLYEDLDPGETETTTDSVPLKGNADPVIVAVDDDLSARLAQARREEAQRIANEIKAAQQRQAEAIETAALRREEAVRGRKPVPSDWDGITPEANAWLKQNLRDYDSMKLVSCSIVIPWGQDAWLQHVKYRARNGFGGMNLISQGFVIRNGRVIDIIGGE